MTTTPNRQSSQSSETSNDGRKATSSSEAGRQMARWNPLGLLEELQDEMSRLWGRPLGPTSTRPARLPAQLPLGGPRIDAYEDGGYLVVKADLPGGQARRRPGGTDNGDLVIRSETRIENEVKDDQHYRMERRVGTFYRRVPLPFDARADDIQATMNDGVLKIRIPKPPESQSTARPTSPPSGPPIAAPRTAA